MSLRAMPPEQQIDRSRWRHLRYVPLSILVVIAAVAAVTGAVIAPTHPASAPDGTRPATVDNAGSSDVAALPSVCRPPVEAPTTEPWLGAPEDRAAAQATWDAHADELSEPYVTEQDGWYDWSDVQAENFSQAVGRRVLSVDEATAWHGYFSAIRDELEAQGIPLFIVIAPAKWDVYPDVLPEWAQQIRGSNSFDQMLALYPDLPLVDVRAPLRAAAADEQMFSRTNSHWTDLGGYEAWQVIASCMEAADPAVAGLSGPVPTGVEYGPERNEFAPYGAATGPDDWTTPVYDPALPEIQITDNTGAKTTLPGASATDMVQLPAETRTDSSPTGRTALFVRDSFGNALSIPLQQVFATTWQVRHNVDDGTKSQPDVASLASQHGADVVILEVAERYFSLTPPS